MKYSVVDPDKNERADKLNYLILGLWILDFTVVFCRVVVVGSGIIIPDPQHWWNNLFVLSNSRPARQHETLCNEICRAVGGSTHQQAGVTSQQENLQHGLGFRWLKCVYEAESIYAKNFTTAYTMTSYLEDSLYQDLQPGEQPLIGPLTWRTAYTWTSYLEDSLFLDLLPGA